MMNYKRGDVILVPFPFSDQTTIKKRPAVIISTNKYNDNSSDVIIIAITSQVNIAIDIGECLIVDWQKAGLIKTSSIKPAISTIEKALILKNLGRLSDKDIYSMNNALCELLSGLSRSPNIISSGTFNINESDILWKSNYEYYLDFVKITAENRCKSSW